MDATGLSLKIDSKGAQADLAALNNIFGKTSKAADKLDSAIARMATSADANLNRASRSMGKYAEVAALLSKIKISGGSQSIQEMSRALDGIGRARGLSPEKIASVREFGKVLASLHVPASAAGLTHFLNGLATAKFPTANAIQRLEKLFTVLSSAREMPGANKITSQLNSITAAATRASRALNTVNGGSSVRSIGSGAARSVGGGASAEASAGRMNRSLIESEAAAKRASSGFSDMRGGLNALSGQFSITSQAGMLLSTVFASFAAGQFVRALYDSNIALLKLQKAVLFATGTFDGASNATDKYIAMSMELGLSIRDNIDTYGRFVIASKASNLSLEETNKIYHAVGQAMTVIGSSAAQQQNVFYGLTEMLSKGVVSSKEFNRQIGLQLPGNAILGARALSQLEGKVVSVAEFFKRMRTGTLLSPQFVPAWAEQVEKMYHPLLALAQARPDIALARLNNAFFIFARQVGQGSFMSAIGNSITGLMNKFIMVRDGVDVLTPQAQKLADTLGHGLATSIHTLGDSLSFVVDHFDTLFTMLKGFVAYKMVREFEAIGASALMTAAKLGGFSTATRAVATAEAAVVSESRAMATQTAVQAIVAPAANEAAAIANLSGGLSFGRRAPRSSFQRPSMAAAGAMPNSFGQRLNLPLFSYADRAEADAARFRPNVTGETAPLSGAAMRAGLGYGVEETATLGSRVASVGSGIFKGLSVAVSAMGPIAMGSAIALAMFSDKLTGVKTAAGNAVTYGDIASGAIQSVIDSVGGWIKSLAGANSAISRLTTNDIFGRMVAGLLAFGKAVVSFWPGLAASVGTILGTWVSDIINMFVRGGQAIAAAMHGNFSAAGAIWAQGIKDRENFANSEGSAIRSYMSASNVATNYNDILGASQRDADSRGATTKQDTAQQRALEASLRQQNAAQIIEHAAQTFAEASLGMNQLTDKIDPTKLMQNIRDFATGKNPNAGLTPGQIAAAGPGANQDVKRIVGDAAKAAGIDPALLFNLGISETHFDPRQYGYGKGGTSARGPFQLTTGALSDLSKAGFNTSDPYSLAGSAPLAAQYLKMSQDQFRRSAGRDLLPYEAMLPYKLGGAGAGLLARIQESGAGDSTLATSLFPTAAKAAGNHSLFYAGKDNSTPLTASMLYAKIVGMAQGSTPRDNGETSDISALATGQGGGSAADAKINSVADESYKKVMAFVGEGSPALVGMAAFQEKMVTLKSTFQEMQAKAATNPWVKTFFANPEIIDGINRAMAELKKKADEAADPVGTMVKYAKQANDVTALRAKGLTDEADWQTEVNRLTKEGYTLAEISKNNAKEAFLTENDHTDTLKTQVDLQKQLNDLEVKRMARISNSAVDNLVNAQILANVKPGETLAQARTAQANQIPYYQQTATAQIAGSRDEVIQGFGESITSLQQSYGLSASEKAYQADYISGLQKLTHLSTDSLSRLSSVASEADKKAAASFASAKQILEEPPGFEKWANAIEPLAKRLEDIKANFAEGLSNTLTDIAVGDEKKPGVAFKKLFDDVRKQTVKAQFDTLLSGIFKTPQTPEQKQTAAMQTFATGSDTFANAVTMFAQTVAVAGGASPAQAASGVTALMAANSGGIPNLRGALDMGSAANDNGINPVTITPMQSITGVANDNSGASSPNALTAIGNLFGINSKNSTGQNIANGVVSLVSDFGPLLNNLFKKTTLPTAPQTNVLGQMSTNAVTGTAQPGQANILGGILTMVANAVLGQANGAASAATGANGSLGDYLSNFGGNLESQFSNGWNDVSSAASSAYNWIGTWSEGGYSTSPVSRIATAMSFANAPSYAEGTANTNGIPAILHPNEAVIPLSRNRKIPIEGGNDNQPMNFTSNVTVIAPNPDGFRQSRNSINREQNKMLKRGALRNLTGAA